MPDLTTKLGLTKPNPGSEQFSRTLYNNNLQKIDDAIGSVFCTSSTRPSTPWDGMRIYETDTGLFYNRIAGAWVLERALTLATATRPVTGLYNGFTIYRTDKGFFETYNGSVWRVRDQGVLVALLADVTDPVTGQTVTLTSDATEYRWNGSAWVAIRHLDSSGSAEYERSTNMTLGTGVVRRIDFNVDTKTCSDITKATVNTGSNGSGSEFTCTRAGEYLVSTQGSITGNASGLLRGWWIGGVNDAGRYAMNGQPPGGFFNAFSVSKTLRMSSGGKFSVYGYQDSGVSLDTILAQAPVNITIKWTGPL